MSPVTADEPCTFKSITVLLKLVSAEVSTVAKTFHLVLVDGDVPKAATPLPVWSSEPDSILIFPVSE